MDKGNATDRCDASQPAPKKVKRSSTLSVCAELKAESLEKINPENRWIDLQVPASELRCSLTFTSGQTFSWKEVGTAVTSSQPPANHAAPSPTAWGNVNATQWVGVIGRRAVHVVETEFTTMCRLLTESEEGLNFESFMREYFQLDISLDALYQGWAKADPASFTPRVMKRMKGIRVLNQPAWDTLLCFMASSNNNIPRIYKLMEDMRENFGPLLCSVDGYKFYGYPTLEDLARVDKSELRALGFGYRDNFYVKTCELLTGDASPLDPITLMPSSQTLTAIRGLGKKKKKKKKKETETETETETEKVTEKVMEVEVEEEKKEEGGKKKQGEAFPPVTASEISQGLMKLHGVGQKVADCITLFSMGGCDIVPADTHVFQMAARWDSSLASMQMRAKNEGKAVAFSKQIHQKVAKVFRDKFPGGYAGWAHTVLFLLELPSFKKDT